MERKYRIGLDVGIGSLGWAIISGNGENARIEDFGVRLFESGELDARGKDRKSQQRRGFRGVRRLVRRRYFRKYRIKSHLEKIGLTTLEKVSAYYEKNSENIYELRERALNEQITAEQIAACLIHICNHRGYRDFYDTGEESDEQFAQGNEEEEQEEAENKKAVSAFDKIYLAGRYQSVAECICKEFNDEGKYPTIRNRSHKSERFLIRREYLENEARKILEKQSQHYPCLNQFTIDTTIQIIFSQRDFEDGPGDANDRYRRYTGVLDSAGFCMYYKREYRGYRATVHSDVFAVVNTLSQYRYVVIETGENLLPPAVAKAFIDYLLLNGNITLTDVKRIAKSHGILAQKSENSDDKALSKAIKYLKVAKSTIEKVGLSWSDFIAEPQFDLEHPSKLHRLGETISKYQTPSRRMKELAKLEIQQESLLKAFSSKKISGTSNVSYKYMREAIEAFLHGEIYGNFQAEQIKAKQNEEGSIRKGKYLQLLEDEEVKNNPVVFRAINETRKVLNAIINTYGSPECINVEVASELNRSYLERVEILRRQNKNKKENERITAQIAEFLKIPFDEIRAVQIEKYKLLWVCT